MENWLGGLEIEILHSSSLLVDGFWDPLIALSMGWFQKTLLYFNSPFLCNKKRINWQGCRRKFK
jgi:hypothetical protein